MRWLEVFIGYVISRRTGKVTRCSLLWGLLWTNSALELFSGNAFSLCGCCCKTCGIKNCYRVNFCSISTFVVAIWEQAQLNVSISVCCVPLIVLICKLCLKVYSHLIQSFPTLLDTQSENTAILAQETLWHLHHDWVRSFIQLLTIIIESFSLSKCNP